MIFFYCEAVFPNEPLRLGSLLNLARLKPLFWGLSLNPWTMSLGSSQANLASVNHLNQKWTFGLNLPAIALARARFPSVRKKGDREEVESWSLGNVLSLRSANNGDKSVRASLGKIELKFNFTW